MIKVVSFLLLGMIVLASCSKKTHPAASTPVRQPVKNPSIERKISELPSDVPTNAAATPAMPAPPASAPMIVIDETGRVINGREKLPSDISARVDYTKIARGYTPVQRQNLINRFKIVPPRVIFVPDQLASKNAKGSYVIYKKKFWYWKKADGLFHIDETYYQ